MNNTRRRTKRKRKENSERTKKTERKKGNKQLQLPFSAAAWFRELWSGADRPPGKKRCMVGVACSRLVDRQGGGACARAPATAKRVRKTIGSPYNLYILGIMSTHQQIKCYRNINTERLIECIFILPIRIGFIIAAGRMWVFWKSFGYGWLNVMWEFYCVFFVYYL